MEPRSETPRLPVPSPVLIGRRTELFQIIVIQICISTVVQIVVSYSRPPAATRAVEPPAVSVTTRLPQAVVEGWNRL